MMGFLEDERVRRYLEALQKERKKIQMFQRELPLCYELISQAIESYGQQMVCDEETSINVPVLEEFIPIKRMRSVEEKGEEEGRKDVKGSGDHEQNQAEKKPDWLRSVRLWTQNLNSPKHEAKIQKPLALDARKVKGAFHPFCGDWKNTAIVEPTTTPTPALASTPTPPPLAAASSTGDAGGSGGGGHVNDRYSNRKPRRCWSPELHRRFLHAVQELGGSHAATPKQIGELMKVDGLTNDEVKSHLQKYRLHTRRSSSSVLTSNGDGVRTPQFILVGGIWVPPPPVTESSAAPTSRIYAPVASVPMSSTCNSAKGNKSGGGDSTNSTSAATSGSSLTVTASAGL